MVIGTDRHIVEFTVMTFFETVSYVVDADDLYVTPLQ